MSARVLLVDDDPALLDMLCLAFEDAGFEAVAAADGAAGWRRFSRDAPDLAILDVLMPEVDGLELCRRIRGAAATPIILLTSRATETDVVWGLELGADDYVAKPFSTRELIARARAALRRSAGLADPEVRRCGPLRIDRRRREVGVGDRRVDISATEFELLWTMAGEPGRVFERSSLLAEIYGDVTVCERNIDTFVKRLRAKLGEPGRPFESIETVRGVGYRIRDAA